MSFKELLRDQGQFQVALITGVVVENHIHDIVSVEVLALALGVKADGDRAGQAYRLGVGHIAVFVEGSLSVIAVLQTEADLIFFLLMGYPQELSQNKLNIL